MAGTEALDFNEQLTRLREQTASRFSPEQAEMMARARTRLELSGIADRSLQVGDKVPDFALPNVRGDVVRLSDTLKSGPVVTAFYRGEWCVYCNLQLRAYQAALPEIHALGGSLIAISPQVPDNSLSTAEKNALEFQVLSDVGNRVARAFGVVFTVSDEIVDLYRGIGRMLPEINGTPGAWELPVPGTFIVDRDRVVTLAHVDPDHTRRLEPAKVIEGLRAFA